MFRNRRLNEVRPHRRFGASKLNGNGPTTGEPTDHQTRLDYSNNFAVNKDYQDDGNRGRLHQSITNLGSIAGLKSRLGLSNTDTNTKDSARPVSDYGTYSHPEFHTDTYSESNVNKNIYRTRDVAHDLDRIYATSHSHNSDRPTLRYDDRLQQDSQEAHLNGENRGYIRRTPYTVPLGAISAPTVETDAPLFPFQGAEREPRDYTYSTSFASKPIPNNTANNLFQNNHFNANVRSGWNGGLSGTRRGSGRVKQETDASGSPTRTPAAPTIIKPSHQPLSVRSTWPTTSGNFPSAPATAGIVEIDTNTATKAASEPQEDGDVALDMLKHELQEMRTLLAQLQRRADTDSGQVRQGDIYPKNYNQENRYKQENIASAADISVTAAEIKAPSGQSSTSLFKLKNPFSKRGSNSKNNENNTLNPIISLGERQQPLQKRVHMVAKMILRLSVYVTLLIAFGKLYVALVELTELKNTPF